HHRSHSGAGPPGADFLRRGGAVRAGAAGWVVLAQRTPRRCFYRHDRWFRDLAVLSVVAADAAGSGGGLAQPSWAARSWCAAASRPVWYRGAGSVDPWRVLESQSESGRLYLFFPALVS